MSRVRGLAERLRGTASRAGSAPGSGPGGAVVTGPGGAVVTGHGIDPAAPLAPEVVTRLARHRLAVRSRVTGSRAGAHRSTRHGHSVEFADQRPYLAGDDPRTLDLAASRRLGRLLVRVHEAEDDTALRVVVDASASMAFGGKLALAGRLARALALVAAHGGDRVRVVVATGAGVVASPWARGPGGEAVVAHALRRVAVAAPSVDHRPGTVPLVDALRRAHGEGPPGPVVLVSDLLVEDWDEVLRALGRGRGDDVLVHVLGRDDREPELDGDVELVDAETGLVVSLAATDQVLADHRRALAAWQADVATAAARRGVALVAADEADDVATLVGVGLRRAGIVA